MAAGTINITLNDGKSRQFEAKDASDINECEQGKAVLLLFQNKKTFEGIFMGIDDDNIVLQSTKGDNCIGLPVCFLKGYFEETT